MDLWTTNKHFSKKGVAKLIELSHYFNQKIYTKYQVLFTVSKNGLMEFQHFKGGKLHINGHVKYGLSILFCKVKFRNN